MKKQEITRRGGISGRTAHMKNERHKTGYHGAVVCLCLCLVLIFGGFPAIRGIAFAGDSGNHDDASLASMDPTRPGSGYSAVLYNNRNGLPTSEANAIAQTAEGFIWIGSYSGLIRYDGNTFERMDSTTGIASVVSLFVDSKNRLWVGTNDAGVAVIDKGKTKMFRIEDGLKSLSVRSITEDSNGNIYVATTRGIAEINQALNVRTIDQVLIRDEYIRQLTRDEYGHIYGLTQSGALFTIEAGVLGSYYDLPGEGISDIVSVFPDPYNLGYLYLGSNGSKVYHVDIMTVVQRNYREINVAPLSCINDIVRIDSTIWFCANNGIGIMENGNLRILDTVPMTKSVDHMMGDYQNNIWFTSSRQGVMKITPNRFADVFEWYDLPATVVNSTCSYNDWMLFGTDDGLTAVSGTSVVEKWGIQSIVTPDGRPIEVESMDLMKILSGVRIRSIIRDSKNRVWFSTYNNTALGLMCYDRGTVTCFRQADGMPSNRIRTVVECADGTIWAVCTGGVAVIRDGKIVAGEMIDEKDGLHNTEILTVAQATNGDCLIGTDGGGIYIIGNSGVRCIDTTSGLSSDVVMRIKKDPYRDIYWIVTSNALAYMNASYEVTVVKNFPYSNNFDLYENSKGEMWILSSNGVYVIPAAELLRNEKIDPHFYNRDDGLSNVATSNSYSELQPDGTLYIAGSEGVTMVNIESNFDNVADLKMAVPFVLADGIAVYPDESGLIRIKADVKTVSICSYVFTYSLSNPQVTYWLEGFDHRKTTVSRSELAPIPYTNLHGKTYYFHMEIRDPNGTGVKTLTVRIVKNKMFYEYWWFQAIAIAIGILLIAGVVFLFVRRRIHQLEAKEAEQKTFINEMIEAFAKTIDMKDSYTRGHSFRVAKYTQMLAEELGCNEEEIEKYHNIALLHDIGKIGVEDKVLKKEGKLEDDEFMQIKSHASLGNDVLKTISIMPELAIGAGAHHERPDGRGYPNGLKGEEIPFVAQIIAVADTFDAMYSDRPYRKRMNFDKAVSIIKSVAGTQLSEKVVEAFLRLVDKGYFRAKNDTGGGSTEDIDNIHKREAEEAATEKAAKAAETAKTEETVKAEETVKTEEPAKAEETAKADEEKKD